MLEVFVEHKFEVIVNAAFEDNDTGKSREIDVRAEYGRYIEPKNGIRSYASGNALVECKNTKNPYVVIGSSVNPPMLPVDSYLHPRFDPLQLFPGKSGRLRTSTFQRLRWNSLEGSFTEREFLGTQLVRMNMRNGAWLADNNGVFDSVLYPLAKASKADREELYRIEDPADVNLDGPEFYFYYPMLVTSGPVYAVDVGVLNPTAQRVPWARIIRQFEDRNLRGTHFMDVVEYAELRPYIQKRILRYIEAVARTMSNSSQPFEPSRLLKTLGEPDNRPLFDAWVRKSRREVT